MNGEDFVAWRRIRRKVGVYTRWRVFRVWDFRLRCGYPEKRSKCKIFWRSMNKICNEGCNVLTRYRETCKISVSVLLNCLKISSMSFNILISTSKFGETRFSTWKRERSGYRIGEFSKSNGQWSYLTQTCFRIQGEPRGELHLQRTFFTTKLSIIERNAQVINNWASASKMPREFVASSSNFTGPSRVHWRWRIAFRKGARLEEVCANSSQKVFKS